MKIKKLIVPCIFFSLLIACFTLVNNCSNDGSDPFDEDSNSKGKYIYCTSSIAKGSNKVPESISVYNIDDSGNVVPIRTIAGANTGIDGPEKIFTTAEELFITNVLGSIVVFDREANGNASYKRRIQGDMTQLNGSAGGIFIVNGEMFVSSPDNDRINIYNQTDTGNIAPKRSIMGGNTQLNNPSCVFITNNKIFVTNRGSNSITVYGQNSSNDVAPSQVITSANMDIPHGISVVDGEIFVVSNNGIHVFRENANGNNVVPVREIMGANTELTLAFGIWVTDTEIFAVSYKNNSILVFNKTDSGNVAPIRKIAGEDAGLTGPTSICVQQGSEAKVLSDISVVKNDSGITIEWKNSSQDIIGFYLWKSQNNQPFQNITPLMILTNAAGEYSYFDRNISEGNNYQYKLQQIDIMHKQLWEKPFSLKK